MNDICICMGSSCYARGNNRNLEVIRAYLREHGLDGRVKVSGSLCLGECRRGPNISIDGTLYHGLDRGALLDVLKEHHAMLSLP